MILFYVRSSAHAWQLEFEKRVLLVAMSESPEVCQFSSTEAISTHCYNVSASN